VARRLADGTGHSLSLVRPSYGENDFRAWSESDSVGGSPGVAEPLTRIHWLLWSSMNGRITATRRIGSSCTTTATIPLICQAPG
jgi:hypothetical protein